MCARTGRARHRRSTVGRREQPGGGEPPAPDGAPAPVPGDDGVPPGAAAARGGPAAARPGHRDGPVPAAWAARPGGGRADCPAGGSAARTGALDRLLAAFGPATARFTELPEDAWCWLPDVVRLGLAVGDRAVAEAAARTSQAEADQQALPVTLASAAHCRGLVAADPDEVLSAADTFGAGYPLFRAQALENAAVLLGRRGDLAGARQALTEAPAGRRPAAPTGRPPRRTRAAPAAHSWMGRAHRHRAADRGAGRGRQYESRHRERAVPVTGDRQHARLTHPGQARRSFPGGHRARGHGAEAGAGPPRSPHDDRSDRAGSGVAGGPSHPPPRRPLLTGRVARTTEAILGVPPPWPARRRLDPGSAAA